MKYYILSAILIFGGLFMLPTIASATTQDSDGDSFSNDAEIQVYGTDPHNPQSYPGAAKKIENLTGPKRIDVDLSEQRLRYYVGETLVDSALISSGTRKYPSPVGTFSVLQKIPVKAYAGPGYYLPNTKWNLKFSNAGYYVHGAYWHNNFGRPMSHGCINVSYADMPQLYAFADTGTRVTIRQ